MQAKLMPDYRWTTAQVAGAEFVKSEFRPVPPGREAEARASGILECVSAPVVEEQTPAKTVRNVGRKK